MLLSDSPAKVADLGFQQFPQDIVSQACLVQESIQENFSGFELFATACVSISSQQWMSLVSIVTLSFEDGGDFCYIKLLSFNCLWHASLWDGPLVLCTNISSHFLCSYSHQFQPWLYLFWGHSCFPSVYLIETPFLYQTVFVYMKDQHLYTCPSTRTGCGDKHNCNPTCIYYTTQVWLFVEQMNPYVCPSHNENRKKNMYNMIRLMFSIAMCSP